MRRLASGVCVITSLDGQGIPHAMTATSVTSVSDEPASMLVCINQNSNMHQSIALGGELCINVLATEHEAISNRCAFGDQGISRFDEGRWDKVGQLPYLADALASFICNIDKLIEYGTHTIVIGQVKQVIVPESENIDPLIYVTGGYKSLKS